ncbi:MAG: HAD-IB family hydrolase [Bacteroidales bacterium]|nr:HAD-IB family hydrolase [Bacteroidales bacterium]
MGTISSEKKSPEQIRIAFFDLDRTITGAVSGRLLVTGAYGRGLMKKSDILKALWLSSAYRLNLRDPVGIMNEMILWVKGIKVSDFEDLCSYVVSEALLPSVFKEAVAEIGFHRRNNVRTVLLSSSVSPICRRISHHLDIEDMICSELEASEGILTGMSEGALCYGEEKARRIGEYCEKNNSSPADAWYYGDSISDLPALSIVGNPVCVNPDRQLEKEAFKREWKICRWK